MGSLSLIHWAVVVGVVLLLFGGAKASSLMGDVAKGIKDFRRNLTVDEA